MFEQIDFSITPFDGSNPPVTKPNPSFLECIGEDGMRELLRDFYIKLFESPIAHLFEDEFEDMMKASENSADFFIQICGGKKYFNQNRGAPQMRKRHAPFAITPTARLHWLTLFEQSIKEKILNSNTERKCPVDDIQSFWRYLDIFSLWMVNTVA